MCDGLTDGHSSRLAVRNSGREGGVKHVDVERNINGSSKLESLERWQFPHLHNFNPEARRLLSLMRIHGPDTDLNQPLHQSFFHDPGKRTSVRIAVPLKFLVQVGMGVEVNQGEIGKVLSEGSQDWIRNRVVATEANRTLALIEQYGDRAFDRDECAIG